MGASNYRPARCLLAPSTYYAHPSPQILRPIRFTIRIAPVEAFRLLLG